MNPDDTNDSMPDNAGELPDENLQDEDYSQYDSDIEDDKILELFEELKSEAEADDPVRNNALIVEDCLANRPINRRINTQIMGANLPDPVITMQILSSLVQTWQSIIVKDKPSVYAVPNNPKDLMAVSAAEIATAVIEHLEIELDWADLLQTSAKHTCVGGASAIKCLYNPATDKMEATPLSIFDIWIENCDNPSDVKWQVIRNHISKHQAKKLIKKVKPEYDGFPTEANYTSANGISRKAVEKYEIWLLPSDREGFEEGLYACVIDNIVVEKKKYPLIFDDPEGTGTKAMLPAVWWTCRKVRGSTLGETWALQCVPLQRTIDLLLSATLEDGMNSRQLLAVDESMRDSDLLDGQNGRLYVPREARIEAIKYLNPAPLDPNRAKALESAKEAIFLTAGISPSTMGAAEASQSGRAMSYQNDLDASKHAESSKSLAAAIRGFWELALKQIQKFYSTPKQIAIAGRDNFAFTGADIQGITLRLEYRSENESRQAFKVDKANQMVAGGLADKSMLTSVSPTSESTGQRLMANSLLDRLIAGEDVSIGPETVNPEVMLTVIEERVRLALLKKNINLADALMQLQQQLQMDLNAVMGQEPGPPQAGQAPASAGVLPESVESERPPTQQ